MFKFKLKPKLLEKIAVTRQVASWEPDVAIRIAGNKETAKKQRQGRYVMHKGLYRRIWYRGTNRSGGDIVLGWSFEKNKET